MESYVKLSECDRQDLISRKKAQRHKFILPAV
jgi:hypothetical protein